MRLPLVALLTAALAGLSGCGPNPLCQRGSAVDLSERRGTCAQEVPDRPFGTLAQCGQALGACSGEDQAVVEQMMDCFDALPACDAEEPEAFFVGRRACYAQAEALSEGCQDALYRAGVPGTDLPPYDAGVDAGILWDVDGSGAVEAVGVADETSVLLGWSVVGEAEVASWEVLAETDAGIRVPVASVSAEHRTYEQTGLSSGSSVRLFVVGRLADGGMAYTTVPDAPDAGPEVDGGTEPDAGSGSTCTFHAECGQAEVCNLGRCEAQACTGEGQATCPSGYVCSAEVCSRQSDTDGGLPGGADAGVEPEVSRPLLSELVTVTTAPPTFSAPRRVTEFLADGSPVAVSLSPARQVVLLEQEGGLYVHHTHNRGRTWTARVVDTVGSRPSLAWQPDSNTLFACYSVGQGVRLRRSLDQGASWDLERVTDVDGLPVEAGGSPEGTFFQECAVAPWHEGGMLLATVEGPQVVVRTVAPDLSITRRVVAFDSALQPHVRSPKRLQLASLPSANVAHIVFTGTRDGSSGSDTEIYGTWVEPGTAGQWREVQLVSDGTLSGEGSPQPQDYPTLALDPTTGRPVAAYVSYESVEGTEVNNIRVAFFIETANYRGWVTTGNLNVFEQEKVGRAFLVMTDRKSTQERWQAFAPRLAVTADGRLTLTFLSGAELAGQPTAFYPYLVPFSFEAKSPSGASGWFVPPARRVSQTRGVTYLRGQFREAGLTSVADPQLAVHTFLIEGEGQGSGQPGDTVQVSLP